ncbi:MAG: hypothetical protein FWE22_02545 [Firmicutes bacterium]|nr:hypothetical protein [Bacillota bacterium]
MKYHIKTDCTGGNYEFIEEVISLIDFRDVKKTEQKTFSWVADIMDCIDRMAIGFNLHIFYEEVFPNFPRKMNNLFLNESIIHFCNLTTNKKNNLLSITNILDITEKEIDNDNLEKFKLFKLAVLTWLQKQSALINNAKTLRDKFIAHKDVRDSDKQKTIQAMNDFLLNDYIKTANILVEIFCFISHFFGNSVFLVGGYTDFNEYSFAYEILRYLDKTPIRDIKKNRIIHNIDIELKEIKKIQESLTK